MDLLRWVPKPLNRMADRAALGAAGALMNASWDASSPGGVSLAPVLGSEERPIPAVGALAWNTLHALLAHKLRVAVEAHALGDAIADEVAEEFLDTVLRLMQIRLILNPAYRKNVAGFTARYQFESTDHGLTKAAIFEDGRLHVREAHLEAADLVVRFADGLALLRFVFDPKRDVLDAMLHDQVRTEGNLNYLYRFVFLARRLQPRFGRA